jgi:acetylornithine deacetylase
VAADPFSREEILHTLQSLIRTPSVNPTIAPSEPYGEAAIAAVVRDWLEQRSIRAAIEEAAPGRPNVFAEIGSRTGSSLVLCAHLDTVGTAGMTIPPFEPSVENGKVFGRGSYDMKGSVAAILAAAVALSHDHNLPGRVLLAFVADEEDASLGARDFVRRHSADAAILTEPSEGRLILAHKGFVWLELTTRGRAAHGSRWDLGVSAIAKMARVVESLERFDRETLRRRDHPLVGPASQHCALIKGGSGLSTYSESCVLRVERRTLPGETPEQVLAETEAVVRESGEKAEVRLLLDRPPLVSDSHSPLARAVRDAATAVTGHTPEDAGVAYWMDAAVFAAGGIPAVNYGPAGAGAHEAVEWVDLDSVVSCARVLAESARRFLSRVS